MLGFETKDMGAPGSVAEHSPRWSSDTLVAAVAGLGIALHLAIRYGLHQGGSLSLAPLCLTLLFGGIPLLWDIAAKVVRRDWGADLIAGASIVTSALLGEYLAGSIVVLMLSGGHALERFAVDRASDVLRALARRMPLKAHRQTDTEVKDVALGDVQVGDLLVLFPHEACPVDGDVVAGSGTMDESYLTGEPFQIAKAPGSTLLSGAVNGASALTFRATRRAVDSRYAKIMEVMRETERTRPQLRRLGDRLGAIYAPLTLVAALVAWEISGDPVRFLAVLVIATPCPLIIAIPVAIIGAISLAAKRGIIIKNPAILEEISNCRTIIFDKTGTLTYGRPTLAEQVIRPGIDPGRVLQLAASLERYSKHPLSTPILEAARKAGASLEPVTKMSERPGEGLRGTVAGRRVAIVGRKSVEGASDIDPTNLPSATQGLECVVLVDGALGAVYRFHDDPREDSSSFVRHLAPLHGFKKVILMSGDREGEVRYLAGLLGIREVYFGQSPEEKASRVAAETRLGKTLFVGDGINDAPALMASSVGVAFGVNSDITGEAASAVIMESSLERVDELFHIGRRLRRIALQSAVGGMALSCIGMAFAATGHLSPVTGAVAQEVIDLLAVLNAVRMTLPPRALSDFGPSAAFRPMHAGGRSPVV